MKLLYISSGYGGIYRMFDQWIEESFIDSPYSCVKVDRETLPAHMHKIRTFSPDFVFMMIGDHIPTELLHQFKQEKIPVVLWMTEDPFYIDVSAACVSDAQLILTIDEGALSFYKQMGADHTHYFPIPTNTHVFQKKESPHESCIYDIALIGYPYPNRIKAIDTLLHQNKWRILVAGKEWHRVLNKSRRRYRDLSLMTHWLSPEQMADIYQTSAIVLNPHRPAQFAYNQNKANVQNMSLNNRAFDIAASGGFQLTDLQPSQAFSSFAFYTHENDLIKQVEHYVKNPQQRQSVAENNYEQVVRWNTFDTLPYRLYEIVKSAL
ncbi:CgeB family protein [Bacillus altitudinis]|uniref:CgeB family protein n=2 Tax=Bacillus altitudinis TaxID=293387 RepID=UPI002FFF087C